MLILLSIPAAFILDLLLGDPSWLPHPVVLMGKCITGMERFFRKHFPKTRKGELAAGSLMAFLLPVLTFAVTAGISVLAWFIHPAVYFAVQVFWNYQALAVMGLYTESRRVYACLERKDLPAARQAVSRIVGRDTENLTGEGVTRAAVETVAESFSDGIIAPLFYMALGGAPLALTYKAVNTMDSMCGYKNEKYLYYGRTAAKLDDVWNFIPSRLAALILILTSFFVKPGMGRLAFRIWKRDRRNHASPNSAQTESACAGALGIRLAGPASYFGKLYEKPYIGDPLRPVEPEDILRADDLMILGSILGMIIFAILRLLVFLLTGLGI